MIRIRLNPAANQKGFTLMELMIVVAIMAVLTMAAIPSLQNYLATTRLNVHLNNYEEAQRFIAAECSKAVAGGVRTPVVATLNGNGTKTAPGNGADPLATAFAATANATDASGQVIITGLTDDLVEPGSDVTVSLGTAAKGATAGQYPGGTDGADGAAGTMPAASTINCASN